MISESRNEAGGLVASAALQDAVSPSTQKSMIATPLQVIEPGGSYHVRTSILSLYASLLYLTPGSLKFSSLAR